MKGLIFSALTFTFLFSRFSSFGADSIQTTNLSEPLKPAKVTSLEIKGETITNIDEVRVIADGRILIHKTTGFTKAFRLEELPNEFLSSWSIDENKANSNRIAFELKKAAADNAKAAFESKQKELASQIVTPKNISGLPGPVGWDILRDSQTSIGNAAKQGDPEAQYALGIAYDLAGNYLEAAKWLKKAADQEVVGAQMCLGKYYYRGKGVAQNKAEAVKWIQRAASHGLPLAKTTLLELGYTPTSTEQVMVNTNAQSKEVKRFKLDAQDRIDVRNGQIPTSIRSSAKYAGIDDKTLKTIVDEMRSKILSQGDPTGLLLNDGELFWSMVYESIMRTASAKP